MCLSTRYFMLDTIQNLNSYLHKIQWQVLTENSNTLGEVTLPALFLSLALIIHFATAAVST